MIRNAFVSNRTTFFSPDCCFRRQYNLDYIYLLDLSIVLYAQFSQKWNLNKTLNKSARFQFADTDNRFHNTNFKTLNGALSNHQTIWPRALHSEVWPCVWMGNSSRFTFLHQRDLELWDSHDQPIFPSLSLLNWQESFNFLFLLQNIHPLHLYEECWETLCNPNVQSST